MTLILNNEEITKLLPVAECLEQLDIAYRELGEGRAMSRPRSDIYGPVHESGRYVFKTMDGMIPRFETAAIRLNSDVIRWGAGPGGIRKDKQRTAPGEKFVGLILLFSTQNGEPLAIMPDGVIQRLRVACTNALAARYMAPTNASIYALIGSGWQASAQAAAMVLVRPIQEIRIYSPTPEKREKLAAELREQLGIRVQAVEDARTAVRGADIVGAATNSLTPVLDADWLQSNAHVTCVKELELDDRILDRCSQVVVHTRLGRPANYIMGKGDEPIYDHDPKEGLATELQNIRGARKARLDLARRPDLGELVSGQLQPPPHGGLTCFVNVIGLGLQFAALGALAHDKAITNGVGREIPTDWFLESEHP
jgi:ornithine cyclodeaminase/alanine dehydrogenase-like protein (mu-crystallin family)